MTIMNKKSIIFALIILAILAFGVMVLMPDTASAEGGRNIHYGPIEDENDSPRLRSSSAGNGVDSSVGGKNVYVTEYIYMDRPVARPATTQVKTEEAQGDDEEEISDMAANALFGGNSFMPSGITQWILFTIFILLIVILVRRFFGAEQAYHSTPLKHD